MTFTIYNPKDAPLSAFEKGVPPIEADLPIEAVGEQRWNLLNEDLPLPAAVLKEDCLHHNSEWMKAFLTKGGAYLAPHGKTTMSPALFDLQLADGAWAITVSTPHQIHVARSFGYGRILLANQLIGAKAIEYVISELARDPSFEFLCLVDSIANVEAIAKAAKNANLQRPIEVLVEIGYQGGRTGCRSVEEALQLARAIRNTRGAIALRGIEGFEGLLKGSNNVATLELVRAFLDNVVALARACDAESLYDAEKVILSAGGSSFYDVVVEKLGSAGLSKPTMVVVRSGCYITHDSVMYVNAVNALRERNAKLANAGGGLKPALEVWAYVQSRPETKKVIAGLGKRDISYDDQPVPLFWFRPNSSMQHPQPLSPNHLAIRLNDQHCHVAVPEDSPLTVGDMIGFGISHPCLTFDKWRVLHIVDETYRIKSSIRTYF
jgi:D-serine dehydratase